MVLCAVEEVLAFKRHTESGGHTDSTESTDNKDGIDKAERAERAERAVVQPPRLTAPLLTQEGNGNPYGFCGTTRSRVTTPLRIY